jgi:putative transposase
LLQLERIIVASQDVMDASSGVDQDLGVGLDVQIANELMEKARQQGVSLVGEGGLLAGITKTVLQTALDTEMSEHLGYDKGEAPEGVANHRNGTSRKTVNTEVGPIRIDVPRDRAGTFQPQIVPKHVRRVSGFDEAIISLYACEYFGVAVSGAGLTRCMPGFVPFL